MRALALGGGRVRMSWLKAVAVAAAVRKVRRVTSNTIVLGKEHVEHRSFSCSFLPIIHVRKPLVLQPPVLHTENMDADVCYRAAQARDARFDGLFFIAVRSTRIFCRPVCPARTPLRRNVEFYANAPAAQAAGYRPCLRCRPEVSPDLPVWSGTSATVNRALRLIDEGALDDGSTACLADPLGRTPHHLRRLFLEDARRPPAVVSQNRRILFAKRLITQTTLPFSQISFEFRIASPRRVNESMR